MRPPLGVEAGNLANPGEAIDLRAFPAAGNYSEKRLFNNGLDEPLPRNTVAQAPITLPDSNLRQEGLMPAPLFDNNISAYVHKVMDDAVGKPDFGSSWDGSKTVSADNVPKAMRDVVKAAGNGSQSLTGAQLENALWQAHDTIVGEDKSWGFHASKHSFWRTLGMGGDGIVQPKEQDRAARKDAVASKLLAFIRSDRYEAVQKTHYDKAKAVLEAGDADWSVAYGWQVREDGDWYTIQDDTDYSRALTSAAIALGIDVPPAY